MNNSVPLVLNYTNLLNESFFLITILVILFWHFFFLIYLKKKKKWKWPMSFLFFKRSYLILTQLAESTADGSPIFLPFWGLISPTTFVCIGKSQRELVRGWVRDCAPFPTSEGAVNTTHGTLVLHWRLVYFSSPEGLGAPLCNYFCGGPLLLDTPLLDPQTIVFS